MPSLHPSSKEFDAHGRQGWVGALVGGAALMATAGMAGHLQMTRAKQRETAEPIVTVGRESGKDKLIFPLSGCNNDHALTALAIERAVGRYGTVVHTVLPHRNYSITELGRKFIEVREQRPEPNTVILGHSDGARVEMELGTLKWFRREFPVDIMVMEAGFTGWDQIAFPGKAGLGLAAVAGQVYGGTHSRWISEPPFATAAKRRAIRQSKIPDGSLEGWARKVYLIQAQHDPFVRNQLAHASIQRVFGDQEVKLIVDRDFRPAVTHSGSSQYPEVLTSILAGSYDLPQASVVRPTDLSLAA